MPALGVVWACFPTTRLYLNRSEDDGKIMVDAKLRNEVKPKSCMLEITRFGIIDA